MTSNDKINTPSDIDAYMHKFFREYAPHFKNSQESLYDSIEYFLRHALTEYGDAREFKECERMAIEKVVECDKAYNRGYAAGRITGADNVAKFRAEVRNAALDDAAETIAKLKTASLQKPTSAEIMRDAFVAQALEQIESLKQPKE